jgi:hypothetical protein
MRSKPYGEPIAVQVAYDEENLYIAFRCAYSSPGTRDDSIPSDEVALYDTPSAWARSATRASAVARSWVASFPQSSSGPTSVAARYESLATRGRAAPLRRKGWGFGLGSGDTRTRASRRCRFVPPDRAFVPALQPRHRRSRLLRP